MRSDLPEGERDALAKQLATVEKQQNVAAQVQKYLGGAGTIIAIAAKLNVDPQIIQGAQKGLQLGQAAFSVGTALMTGNYLQAASAIASVFGVGGMDPAAQRDAQIMDQLHQINEQLHVLDKNDGDDQPTEGGFGRDPASLQCHCYRQRAD